MKPSNLSEINSSFIRQALDFESDKLHLSKQDYLDYTVRMTEPKKTNSVLEIAAGTCVCGRAIAPYVNHVICLDATSAMLEVGKYECKKRDIRNISFIKGFAEQLPFLDESFDIVISRLAFHHFSEVEKPFSEMVRVLNPGGKLIMIDMIACDENLRYEVDKIEKLRDPSHIKDLTLVEMKNLYKVHGFSIEIQEQTDIPVSLEAWMELTKTDEKIKSKIRNMMHSDMSGKCNTGFSPYSVNGEIYFYQHWVLNIGIKSVDKIFV